MVMTAAVMAVMMVMVGGEALKMIGSSGTHGRSHSGKLTTTTTIAIAVAVGTVARAVTRSGIHSASNTRFA